jgi:hypothetical protein
LIRRTTAQNETTNNIAGDVAVEYQLSQDGRYKLKAYRLNKYRGVARPSYRKRNCFILTLITINSESCSKKSKLSKKKRKQRNKQTAQQL